MDEEQIEKLEEYSQYYSNSAISQMLDVPRSTIYHYQRKLGIENTPFGASYTNTKKIDPEKCTHKHWVKRCSSCDAILESDCQVNHETYTKEELLRRYNSTQYGT